MDEAESTVALILVVVGLLFLALVVTMVMAELAARRIRREVTEAKRGRPVPKSVLPLAQMNEVTVTLAAEYEVLLDEIQRIIETGKTRYSSLQLGVSRLALGTLMRTNILMRRHKLLMVTLSFLSVLFLPFGLIAGIIFFLVLIAAGAGARRGEEIVNQYYRGELLTAPTGTSTAAPPQSAGLAEELGKLNVLRQQGALSEEEFQRAKAKVMG